MAADTFRPNSKLKTSSFAAPCPQYWKRLPWPFIVCYLSDSCAPSPFPTAQQERIRGCISSPLGVRSERRRAGDVSPGFTEASFSLPSSDCKGAFDVRFHPHPFRAIRAILSLNPPSAEVLLTKADQPSAPPSLALAAIRLHFSLQPLAFSLVP